MAMVLVASEDIACLDSISATVESLGHEVLPVQSGAEVLEQALTIGVDMVFVDECLSVFDGYEITSMLRKDPGIPRDLPIVLIKSRDVSPRKLEKAGVTDCIQKDQDSGKVIDLLIECLGEKAPRPTTLPFGLGDFQSTPE